jgi:subfamily B ATP-binding cassette protein MsbA
LLLVSWLLLPFLINFLTRSVNRRRYALADRCEWDFVVEVTAHLLELPMEFHENRNSGGIFQRISRGGMDLNNLIVRVVFTLLTQLLTMVLILAVVFYLDYRLCLGFLVLIALVVYQVSRQAGPLSAAMGEVHTRLGELYDDCGDAVDNIASIKSYTAEKEEAEGFAKAYDAILVKSQEVLRMWTGIQTQQMNLMGAGFRLIQGAAFLLVWTGTFTAGEMLMVILYISLVYQPLLMFSDTYIMAQRSLVSIRSAAALLEEGKEDYESGLLPVISGDIRYKGVSYSYNGSGEETLTEVDVEIGRGQTVAVVGPSGAGKSTFMKLISRFIEAQEGKVYIGGTDITRINLRWLRENVALVPQQVILFNGTIMENIRYGRRDASDAEVEAAARAANAAEFIERMPHKYQQRIGKWGLKLSEGQKKRKAIARALLRNPQILILDEATSALDSRKEREVQEAIDDLTRQKDKTILIIAHRFSTIQGADRILVLDDGRIAESGTHAELYAKKDGIYRELCALQKF